MDIDLASCLTDSEDYFQSVADVLSEYWWLVDFKWTEIFQRDLMNTIPDDWHSFFQNHSAADIKIMMSTMTLPQNAPASLAKYVELCKRNSPRLDWLQFSTPLPVEREKQTSAKKLRESVSLAQFVGDFCMTRFSEDELKTTTIVDIGSGLGYVSNRLSTRGFTVIGVEAREALVKTANSRLGSERLSFIQHYLDGSDKSQSFINSLIPTGRQGILIGLHCCGDLLDHIINAFLKSDRFKAMLCVTCCYHKIDKNKFPRSRALKRIASEKKLKFSPINLRSACQKTPESWSFDVTDQSLDMHTKAAAFRGLLEEVLIQVDHNWKKQRCRIKISNDMNQYISQVTPGFPESIRDEATLLLHKTIQEKEPLLGHVRTLKILHTFMQPVVESVVVWDHVVKLRELGMKTNAIQVFSQIVSPRNTLVISVK